MDPSAASIFVPALLDFQPTVLELTVSASDGVDRQLERFCAAHAIAAPRCHVLQRALGGLVASTRADQRPCRQSRDLSRSSFLHVSNILVDARSTAPVTATWTHDAPRNIASDICGFLSRSSRAEQTSADDAASCVYALDAAFTASVAWINRLSVCHHGTAKAAETEQPAAFPDATRVVAQLESEFTRATEPLGFAGTSDASWWAIGVDRLVCVNQHATARASQIDRGILFKPADAETEPARDALGALLVVIAVLALGFPLGYFVWLLRQLPLKGEVVSPCVGQQRHRLTALVTPLNTACESSQDITRGSSEDKAEHSPDRTLSVNAPRELSDAMGRKLRPANGSQIPNLPTPPTARPPRLVVQVSDCTSDDSTDTATSTSTSTREHFQPPHRLPPLSVAAASLMVTPTFPCSASAWTARLDSALAQVNQLLEASTAAGELLDRLEAARRKSDLHFRSAQRIRHAWCESRSRARQEHSPPPTTECLLVEAARVPGQQHGLQLRYGNSPAHSAASTA